MSQGILIDVLMEYVVEGNFLKVKDILLNISDVNKIFHNGSSMLHQAAIYGRYEIAELLVARGHLINWKDSEFGMTPFHHAIRSGHTKIVKLFMLNGGSLEVVDIDGMAPIHFAAKYGHSEILEYILAKGYSKLLSMLLKSSLNTNAQDYEGKTALHYACANGYIECAKLLLSNKHQKYSDKDMMADIPDEHGNSPLYFAALKGHQNICKLLLSNKLKIDRENNDKETPLFAAVRSGEVAVIRELINFGANQHKQNNNGDTPLLIAAQNGHGAVVKLLIDNGSNINITNNANENAIFSAIKGGSESLTLFLIRKGLEINILNEEGDSALIFAARKGLKDVAETLIHQDIDIYVVNKNGENSFFCACQHGFIQIAKLILRKTNNFNPDSSLNKRAIMAAAKNGHFETVKMLIELNVRIDCTNISGETALHLAAQYGQDLVVRLLLENGAKVDSVDKSGETALHKAAFFGKCTKSVLYLMEFGGNIEATNNHGKTPLNVAAKKTQFNVFETILRNDPNNRKLKDALIRYSRQHVPTLARLIDGKKSLVDKYGGNINKATYTNKTNSEGKYNINDILKSNYSVNYFEGVSSDFVDNFDKIGEINNYRLLIILHWLAFKSISNKEVLDSMLLSFINENGMNIEKTDDIYLINIALEKMESNLAKELPILANELVKKEIISGYHKILDICEKIDKLIVPFIEFCLVSGRVSEVINFNSEVNKRLQKLELLKTANKQIREEKYTLYFSKAKKLTHDENFIQLRNNIEDYYRYKYISQLENNLDIEDLNKEKLYFETYYPGISNEYSSILAKYEDYVNKIEMCYSFANFCKFLDFLETQKDFMNELRKVLLI